MLDETQSLAAQLAELKARQDILDVVVRYCRGADRCDAALMKSCFHADAWDEHGFFNGPAHAFAEQAAKSLLERFVSTKHFVTNACVEIVADQGACETYVLCVSRLMKAGERFDLTFSARYLDRFERRDGVWKIAHRVLVNDGTRVDPVIEQDARLEQVRAGARGPADASYAFFNMAAGR